MNTPRPAPPRFAAPARPPTTFAPPQAAQAGWYADPYRAGQLRWFDGHRWTHHSATLAPAAEPVEEHPVLPIVTALGATVVLAASLIVNRAVISSIDDRWNIFVLMARLGAPRLRALDRVVRVRQPSVRHRASAA